jgi:hypothetical protein
MSDAASITMCRVYTVTTAMSLLKLLLSDIKYVSKATFLLYHQAIHMTYHYGGSLYVSRSDSLGPLKELYGSSGVANGLTVTRISW